MKRKTKAEQAVPDEIMRAKTRRILNLLIEAYGRPRWMPSLDALSELIATVLSQHTSDINSHRAFANLRSTFNSWEEMRRAPVEQIASAIRTAGMPNVKAPRIKETLEFVATRTPVKDELGPQSLTFLADWNIADAKAWLRAIPGVGPKTAACVLMFALNKPALPVDTHVFRVSQRLGLIDQRTTSDLAHESLENLVPPADIYTFHVDMVLHGRRVCKAGRPLCEICNLREECDYYQATFAGTSLSEGKRS